MKKIFLVLAVLSLTTSAASAQLFRLGVKAGVTLLSTDVKGPGAISDSWNEFKSRGAGWHAGLMARIELPLTNLYVQPELLYTHSNYRFTQKNPPYSSSVGQTVAGDLTHGTIELPVLLGFKVLFLNARVGPTFTLANITGGKVYKIASPDVGFQVGLGATLKKVTLDVRYQGYFEKAWAEIDPNDVLDKLRANRGNWGVSLGYFF